jgi:hypothetical protein
MLSFYNSGLINEVSITTFGINAKANDSAIGYFGTGLKYAIAVLLRNGHNIIIKSGANTFNFHLQNEDVRGKNFSIVCMNGKQLGFTTELGKNWELWMAYRELYCNAKDEGGGVYGNEIDDKLFDTVIKVTGLDEIHENNGQFILQSTPIATCEKVTIHQLSDNGIFYKGILVGAYKGMRYSYNLNFPVELTEDRTIKNEWSARYDLTKQLQTLTDSGLIKELVTAEDGYEHDLLWTDATMSVEFKQVVDSLINHQSRQLHHRLKDVFKDKIKSSLLNATKTAPSSHQVALIDIARDFLLKMNYDVSKYPIMIGNLGSGVLGMAKDDTIYLSERVFLQGAKQVTATLLEEYLHLEYDLRDETYEMQNFLFDLLIQQAEIAHGVTL